MVDSLSLTLILLVARAIVGLSLVVAGTAKIKGGTHRFLTSILTYDLVNANLAQALSKAVPWTEIALGSLLLVGLLAPLTALLSFILLMIFTLTLSVVIIQDRPINCGCFGYTTGAQRVRWILVYRNLVLVGLALPIYIIGAGHISLDAWINLNINWSFQRLSIQYSLLVIWIGSFLIAAGLQLVVQRRFLQRQGRG